MNKKKILGVIQIIVAAPVILAGLYALVAAFFIGALGGPCPQPSRMGEARAAGMMIGLIGIAVVGAGIFIGKTGLSLSKSKQEHSNKMPGHVP